MNTITNFWKTTIGKITILGSGSLIVLVLLFLFIPEALATFAVLFAAVSAGMAWWTADKTHKNTQAQVVMTLLDEYGSEEMRQALKGLQDKWEEHQSRYSEKFAEQRKTDPNWDLWRRHVAHYYHKVAVLYDKGLLDKRYAVVVATQEQVEFLVKVIEPLEAGVTKVYGHYMFNVLESLYNDQKLDKP